MTVFTWGYYGWGNHTRRLVEAVDAVEASRDFQAPLFVDIRIRRSVRAAGFTGPAFEKLLGQDRHRWMRSLGNNFILTRTGNPVQIAEPKAAEELLDLAIEAGRHKQRLLFFCSCQWPKSGGRIACHRCTVAGLVLKAAKRRGVPTEVVEWPGGEPKRIELDVSAKHFDAVRKGRISVPLGKSVDLAMVAGLPWCSVATLHAGSEPICRLVGPAVRDASGWALPVLCYFHDADATLNEYESEAAKLRKKWGFEAATT